MRRLLCVVGTRPEGIKRAPVIQSLQAEPWAEVRVPGGVQEEAPALGKPVLVLRTETERPEAVEAGVAKLVGVERGTIVRVAQRLLDDPDHYAQMARGGSPYGDGRAAIRIVEVLRQFAPLHERLPLGAQQKHRAGP